ncbi:hypothetical protein E2K98_05940 [Bacillus salipaludis]|uniref:Uncharacterized protein n=1 Tax=Bacillus salipaludis TaxID=2547811 RepID=A0A4R5VV72_9BACI|nr:hypothetical protein [Bacillus salipaludis]TDK62996.1 hypothetical protein E2K98_05940 [Bacillus salipaludis]
MNAPVDWSGRHEDSSEMLSHFLRAWVVSRSIQCPAGVRGWGDPAGAKRRGGSPARPRTACAWSGNQQTCGTVKTL